MPDLRAGLAALNEQIAAAYPEGWLPILEVVRPDLLAAVDAAEAELNRAIVAQSTDGAPLEKYRDAMRAAVQWFRQRPKAKKDPNFDWDALSRPESTPNMPATPHAGAQAAPKKRRGTRGRANEAQAVQTAW